MAEGLMEPPSKGPADVASAVAAAVAPADPLFGRRIEFHLERKPYSPISSAASQNFHLETLNPSSSNPQRSMEMVSVERSSAAASQSEWKSEGGLDPVFSFRITFRRIGAGLQNLGNTCYLNSVLQCLTYTEPLAAYCQSGEHKSSCRTAGFCAMCALQNHVMVALQSTGKILSPSHLVRNLRCISRNFRNSRQEDAHEYMVNLLESMHKCCLPFGVPTESPSAYEKSLVYKIFGGRLRSQVKCTQCNYCSNKFDPFLDLSLEILKADSLKKALSHFTAMEQLDGGERQYQCQRCKEKVRAFKQLTVHKAPYVLTIHLKRFGLDVPGQKIDKKVDFEPTLDLKPFVSDQQEADLKYTLYGVLVHSGWNTHTGHYYCFVRTSSGMWHSLDDNQVRPVSEKVVLAQKAYMLFYVRDTSSVIKKSADVVRKDNILASGPGSKMVSHSASILNGAFQHAERKCGVSQGSSSNSKADGTSNGRPISVEGTLLGHPLLTGGKNRSSGPKGSLLPSSHASSRHNTCLQANGEVVSDGLRQTALSRDSTVLENPLGKAPSATDSSDNRKAIEESVHSSHSKDNGLTVTSHVNDASFSYEKGQDTKKVESKSRILIAQPTVSGLTKLTSEKHSNNLVREKGLHNQGITNGAHQNNGILCETDLPSAYAEEQKPLYVNGYIGKRDTKSAEHQNTVPESDKCMSNLQCERSGREDMLKIELSESNTPAKIPDSLPQSEAVAAMEIGKCSRAESGQKKLGKRLLKGQYFGRKQLFMTSIFMHKRKRHKRKYHANSRKATDENFLETFGMDDRGLSTSESIKVADATSVCSSKKRFRSSSKKGNNTEIVNDVKCCNDGDVHIMNLDARSDNKVVLATSGLPRRPLISTENLCDGAVDANGSSPVQKGVTSLLMSTTKTTVPRWDDVELPPCQLDDLDGAQKSNIGYVLDEWDEEYDRGKRKKVKKSNRLFGGPNPFQEIANLKLRQDMRMRVSQIGSGNQPLRI